MNDPRFESILTQTRQRYPERVVGVALIEGLPSLARIALTARIARRTLRFVTFQVDSAQKVVEEAVSAAEKVAGGEPISQDEDLAARDRAVVSAHQLEKRHGNRAAAQAAAVARKAARCVYGPELAYGENAFLAELDLQKTVGLACSDRGKQEIERAIKDELRAEAADVQRLILCAESSGEGWLDPDLGQPLDRRNDRGWERLLEAAGISPTNWGDQSRERWQRIHREVERCGGCFYPPNLFRTL
jgi:hypothetical protein